MTRIPRFGQTLDDVIAGFEAPRFFGGVFATVLPDKMSAAPAVTPELNALLRRVKLGRCLDTLPDRLARAATGGMGHVGFLASSTSPMRSSDATSPARSIAPSLLWGGPLRLAGVVVGSGAWDAGGPPPWWGPSVVMLGVAG